LPTSAILERLSPRFDIWEEPEPVPSSAEPISDALQRSIDLAWLVASPLILLVDWLRGQRQTPDQEPAWQRMGQVGKWDIYGQTWIDSETFPPDLDLYAAPEEVYALLTLRFDPPLPAWENRWFFEEVFPAQEGLYLLSYNAPGEGMTLHWLPADGGDPEDVARLHAQAWEIEGAPGGAVQLEAPGEVQVERIMIARRW